MYYTNEGRYFILNTLFTSISRVYLLNQNLNVVVALAFDNQTILKELTENKLKVNVEILSTDTRISGYLPFTVGGIGVGDATHMFIYDTFANPRQFSSSNSSLLIEWEISL